MQPAMCLQCLDILNTKRTGSRSSQSHIGVDCQQWSKAIQLGCDEAAAFNCRLSTKGTTPVRYSIWGATANLYKEQEQL